MLAGAPGDHLGFSNLRLLRAEARALMRSVAERLALGTPAGTPPIRARLSPLNNRRFLTDDWFGHKCNGLLANHRSSLRPARQIVSGRGRTLTMVPEM